MSKRDVLAMSILALYKWYLYVKSEIKVSQVH